MAMKGAKQAKRLAAWGAAWVGMTGLAWGQWSGTNPVTTNSKVGIGTATPDSMLVVNDPGTTDAVVASFYRNVSAGAGTSLLLGRAASAGEMGVIKMFPNATTGRLFLGLWGDSPSSGVGLNVLKGGSVGIGTASPQGTLHVVHPNEAVGYTYFDSSADTNWYRTLLNIRRSRGTAAAKTAVQNNDYLGSFRFWGYDGATFQEAAGIDALVNGSPSTTSMPSDLLFRTTGVNSTSPTERMRITSSGNVGIGTTVPAMPLHVLTSSNSAVGARITNTNTGTSAYTFLQMENNNDAMTGLLRMSSTNTAYAGAGGLVLYSLGAYPVGIVTNNVQRLIVTGGGNVGIGTTSPAHALSVNGTIQAKEVLVNTGWADHVFQPQYRLKPLGELASYIREKGHLPGIPTEADVKAKGVGLAEMQVKLLEKIEELTLHMIAAEERSRLLERKNRDLEERLSKLATRVEGGAR